jgi:hypothetical protein
MLRTRERLDRVNFRVFAPRMDAVQFSGEIRYWNPDKAAGLAVVDVPADRVAALGGLKQQRVRGTINGADFASSTMPAGGGRLALSVSKAMMTAGGVGVGQTATFEINGVGRD